LIPTLCEPKKLEMSNNESKRLCIICDTPYQLLNTISYACSQKEFEYSNVDVLVCNRDISENQINNLKKRAEIGRVFFYNTDLVDNKRGKSLIYKAYRFFLPETFINGYVAGKEKIKCTNYSHLLCAFPMPITVAFTMANPKVRIRLMDDGIGTYTGNIHMPLSKKKSIMLFLKGASSPWNRIEKVYLNNKRYYEGGLALDYEELPRFSDGDDMLNNAIQEIFGYREGDEYSRNRMIYLTQPLDLGDDRAEIYWKTEKTIQTVFKEKEIKILIRRHPKQPGYKFKGMAVDNTNNLWELVCRYQITDEHCLIGCFSTAQFSPKFLFDKEPWIIFTYSLYRGLFDEDALIRMNQMVKKLRNTYEKKYKVIVAENQDELYQMIEMVKDKIMGNG